MPLKDATRYLTIWGICSPLKFCCKESLPPLKGQSPLILQKMKISPLLLKPIFPGPLVFKGGGQKPWKSNPVFILPSCVYSQRCFHLAHKDNFKDFTSYGPLTQVKRNEYINDLVTPTNRLFMWLTMWLIREYFDANC